MPNAVKYSAYALVSIAALVYLYGAFTDSRLEACQDLAREYNTTSESARFWPARDSRWSWSEGCEVYILMNDGLWTSEFIMRSVYMD